MGEARKLDLPSTLGRKKGGKKGRGAWGSKSGLTNIKLLLNHRFYKKKKKKIWKSGWQIARALPSPPQSKSVLYWKKVPLLNRHQNNKSAAGVLREHCPWWRGPCASQWVHARTKARNSWVTGSDDPQPPEPLALGIPFSKKPPQTRVQPPNYRPRGLDPRHSPP